MKKTEEGVKDAIKTTLGPIVAPVQAGEAPIRETKKRFDCLIK